MASPFDNPLGLDGFEFVEFASPTPGVLEGVFAMLGFTKVAVHRSKQVAPVSSRHADVNHARFARGTRMAFSTERRPINTEPSTNDFDLTRHMLCYLRN